MQFESYIVHIVSKDFRLDGDDTFSDSMGGGEGLPACRSASILRISKKRWKHWL